MKTIIECGANLGIDTQRLHEQNPEANIYCFEPTVELLVNILYPKFALNDKIKIFPFAVDIKNGFSKFNIAGQADWGCSSLYEFNENIDKKWPNRPDFKFTRSYTVPTITLFDFCNIYNINEIDYLWIDTQGNDFNVLKSLKDKINFVKSGRCEASMSVQLYKNTDNDFQTIAKWLKEKGFNVRLEPDGGGQECNIFFSK